MFTFDGTPWLTPSEQEEAVGWLIEDRLLEWDNRRKLPLKKGGTTDIYANIRMMRRSPRAIRRLGELYANPIRRLHVDCFAEVPEAVSPLAGHISAITDIPMVTIREEEKTGRVVSGKIVGDIRPGMRVVILDDVVTDAASKIPAIRALRAAGAVIVAIVVLVDRQQGWKKKLAKAGFEDIPVWAGTTLHTVRKSLIARGLMQRCDTEVESRNPLIVALDGKSWEEVLPIIDQLRPSGCILKANDLLDTGDLNKVVSDLSVYGRVMVDRKYHDIPNTVANYCRRLRATPPWGFTLHASGGTEMVKSAVEAFAGTPTIVLAVTLLTSIKDECREIYTQLPIDVVKSLALLANSAGAQGFVCSAEEASMLRALFPKTTIVVPGLRSPGKDANEQKRTSTFAGAKEAGANFFVGGRQFLTAPDPVAEIFRVMKEELGIEVNK